MGCLKVQGAWVLCPKCKAVRNSTYLAVDATRHAATGKQADTRNWATSEDCSISITSAAADRPRYLLAARLLLHHVVAPCHTKTASLRILCRCGTVLNIEDEDLEPLKGQLLNMSLTTKLDLSSTGAHARVASCLQGMQACILQPLV